MNQQPIPSTKRTEKLEKMFFVILFQKNIL